MGRYKFDKFLIRFSKDTQIAIIKDLIECYGINDGDYDWNIIDIRVKKANRALRHRFADTIAKLEAFDKTEISGLYEILENGERDICVSAACFARITGRNRKTVRKNAHRFANYTTQQNDNLRQSTKNCSAKTHNAPTKNYICFNFLWFFVSLY